MSLINRNKELVYYEDEEINFLSDSKLVDMFNLVKQQILREQIAVEKGIDIIKIQDDIDSIYSKKCITIFEEKQILDFLIKLDIEEKRCSLESAIVAALTERMRGFTPLDFFHNLNNSIVNLKDILITTKNSQVVIIYSKAGCGKTSLTR